MTVAMNRPRVRNAVSLEMARELEACLAELGERDDIRVLILTGVGSAFGAGADIKERARLTPRVVQQQRHTGLRIVRLLETLPMPVTAMVNGRRSPVRWNWRWPATSAWPPTGRCSRSPNCAMRACSRVPADRCAWPRC